MFLYFFEAMGVSKDDSQSLKVLFGRLLERKSNVGGEKDLTKAEQDSLKIDFEQNIYTTSSKQAGQKVKTMKRVTKIVVAALVDLYPAKKELLPALIQEIKSFSKSKMRALRFAFT